MRSARLVFIVLIQSSYQCNLLGINVVDGNLFDLLLLIKNGNAAIVSKSGNDQLCNLFERNLMVEGRNQGITGFIK